MSPHEFIDKIAPYAIKHGRANNILTSLIISQAILESASGTSILATKANNLFGIKKGSDWSGEVYTVKTGEYDANNRYFEIIAEFRKFPTFEGAIESLCHKYTHGTGWESHNRYEAVVGEMDYRKATQAVKNAGYATDPLYPQKLNNIIEKYDLTKYDKEDDKMVKIVIDAGHGINTPGKRSPSDEREWTFNNKVAVAAINRFNQYQNVQILRTDDPTGKTDVPLITRTNKANAWGADLLVSIHHNALAGKWHNGGGIETYVQEKTASKVSKDVANVVNAAIVNAMGLRNRGVKTSNLHMLRESRSPAILTEGGFFDSTVDIKALRDDKKLHAQGVAIADAVAKYFGLKLKSGASTPSPTPSKPQDTIKEEEILMAILKGTSGTLNNAFLKYLEDASKKGVVNEKWAKEFKAGKLTIDDAFLLYVYIKEDLNKK